MSPFVRHGAAVQCDGCEHRYRIKSDLVTRQITTGPKTPDGLDPLLRGEKGDLGIKDAGVPVHLDVDGNVVGLSGLSELMRQSDAAHAKAEMAARARAAERSLSPTTSLTHPVPPPHTTPRDGGSLRLRDKIRHLKKKTIIVAVLGMIVVGGLLLFVLSALLGGETPPAP